MTLKTEVPIAEVRIAVRKVAQASAGPVSVNYVFLAKVAAEAGVSTASGDSIERRRWNVFTGQVKRSLAWLADGSELVKGQGSHGPVYFTPAQHVAYVAERARQEAVRVEHQLMRTRIFDELMLYGIPVASERGREIRIEPDGWHVIIEALETARAVRSLL